MKAANFLGSLLLSISVCGFLFDTPEYQRSEPAPLIAITSPAADYRAVSPVVVHGVESAPRKFHNTVCVMFDKRGQPIASTIVERESSGRWHAKFALPPGEYVAVASIQHTTASDSRAVEVFAPPSR
jgi:hypothetical protein